MCPGAAFTRFQTLSFAHRFSGMPKVLSFGPCQFPTLGFVVARHLQIEAFVPQDYWTIAMTWAEPGTRTGSAARARSLADGLTGGRRRRA